MTRMRAAMCSTSQVTAAPLPVGFRASVHLAPESAQRAQEVAETFPSSCPLRYAAFMTTFAHAPATIRIGSKEVSRVGFGAMQLPGPMVWGEPRDPDAARAVLRRVVECGIRLIDTSWYYGPHVANRLIAETLYPYPKDLVLATKLGGA